MHKTYDWYIDIHQSQIMRSLKKPGVIINIGSAAGLYPMYADPIYSGTKGSYPICILFFYLFLLGQQIAVLMGGHFELLTMIVDLVKNKMSTVFLHC
jgi:short-subunit dehydrogenase involved in D-alanine esterification of teichoic acids